MYRRHLSLIEVLLVYIYVPIIIVDRLDLFKIFFIRISIFTDIIRLVSSSKSNLKKGKRIRLIPGWSRLPFGKLLARILRF